MENNIFMELVAINQKIIEKNLNVEKDKNNLLVKKRKSLIEKIEKITNTKY